MKNHTDAFLTLKEQQQSSLDFAVLCCHAIPNLSKTIKGINHNIPHYGLAKPDYFINPSGVERLNTLMSHYQTNLAKYILFSSYSFFEFYFKAVMKELLEFHSGKAALIESIKEDIILRVKKNANFDKDVKKLKEKPKKEKHAKYKKILDKLLTEPTYTPPSHFFAIYGAVNFADKIADGKFVSANIPDILKNLFFMDLSEKINTHGDLIGMDLEQTYESMRKFRNQIGHGEKVAVSLNKVMGYINFLRHFSVKLDKHLVDIFFVINHI